MVQKIIPERVSSVLHRCSVRVKRGVNTLRYWRREETTVEHPRFGEAGWQCPECSKWMHEGVKETHQQSHREKSCYQGTEKSVESSGSSSEVRIRDLIDDYNLDRPEKKGCEEKSFEIQEPTGGSSVKKGRLREKWRPFLEELRESGEVVVTRHQHHGGLRGAHIVRKMRRDLKRLDVEMNLEFDVGETESTVQRRNRSQGTA